MNLTRRSSRPLPGLITERLALQPATANDPQPIYQYIVEDIEARIKRGNYVPAPSWCQNER